MKFLYIDPFSGVSGDKFVASLLSLDESNFSYLRNELSKLKLDNEYSIKLISKKISSIDCCYFFVEQQEHNHNNDHHHKHHNRNYREIKNIIINSNFTEEVKKISLGIFDIIANAESKVHNVDIDDVHFHEIGAIDSIIDIVGTAILIDKLNIGEIHSGAIPFGNGFIETEHGILPIPAPASACILKEIPTYRTNIDKELTTPTGAAIVKYLVNKFSDDFSMNIEKIGYGAGTYDLSIPNFLRVFYGVKKEKNSLDLELEKIVKLETNLDDITSEQLEFLTDILMKNGSLETYIIPVHSKKGRVSFLLNVLTNIDNEETLTELIYLNSTTLGIRREIIERTILKRDIKIVKIDGIDVRIKSAFFKNKKIKETPEYEDVKKISELLSLSYNEAYNLILKKLL